MAAQSKLAEAAFKCSCQEFVHPWTSSCACATAGMLLSLIPVTFKTYSMVYMLALLMRRRIPTLKDLGRTLASTLQSTAFLSLNGSLFVLAICLVRQFLGGFYFGTAAWVPALLVSSISLAVERPQRRAPLALYVANVGIETLWKMLEARGLVRSIANGQVLIMGVSITALMYLYRAGLHRTVTKDATFKGLGVIIGKEEEGPLKPSSVIIPQRSNLGSLNFRCITSYLKVYNHLTTLKHPCCPHQFGCAVYALLGGVKPFLGGVGLQVGFKLLLNISRILQQKMQWRKQIFNKGSLQLGLALGIFSLLFKITSCGFRHSFGYDNALFAIPSGLIGSFGLLYFPNTTVSLYLMLKSLQLLYNWGVAEKKVPEVPNFSMIMYGFFTAVLCHSTVLEAKSMRPSYFKFIENISGGRLSRFNMKSFEAFGVKSQDQADYIIKKLGIVKSTANPLFPLIV